MIDIAGNERNSTNADFFFSEKDPFEPNKLRRIIESEEQGVFIWCHHPASSSRKWFEAIDNLVSRFNVAYGRVPILCLSPIFWVCWERTQPYLLSCDSLLTLGGLKLIESDGSAELSRKEEHYCIYTWNLKLKPDSATGWDLVRKLSGTTDLVMHFN
jgi:hypothetical protein